MQAQTLHRHRGVSIVIFGLCANAGVWPFTAQSYSFSPLMQHLTWTQLLSTRRMQSVQCYSDAAVFKGCSIIKTAQCTKSLKASQITVVTAALPPFMNAAAHVRCQSNGRTSPLLNVLSAAERCMSDKNLQDCIQETAVPSGYSA